MVEFDAEIDRGLSPDVVRVDDVIPFAIETRQGAEITRFEKRQDDRHWIETWVLEDVLGTVGGREGAGE